MVEKRSESLIPSGFITSGLLLCGFGLLSKSLGLTVFICETKVTGIPGRAETRVMRRFQIFLHVWAFDVESGE